MLGPTELLGFLCIFGVLIAVFGAIARAMDNDGGATQHARRQSCTRDMHTTDHGGTVVGHGDSLSSHSSHLHGCQGVTHSQVGHDFGHPYSSGFDSSTSFDVGFGAGGDGGLSGGGFDSGSCGGCDSGGGGGGGD